MAHFSKNEKIVNHIQKANGGKMHNFCPKKKEIEILSCKLSGVGFGGGERTIFPSIF